MEGNMLRQLTSGVMGAIVLLGLTGCGASGINAVGPTSADSSVELVRRGAGGTTRFLAKNVTYRLSKNVTMILEDMNADVLLKDPSMPFVPANKNDYSLQVHYAKVTKNAHSLEALMNDYVFADADSPLKDLKISFKDDRIVMGGKMKKGIWVGFEMEGTLSPTTDGKILMTPKSVKSAGVPVDGLMKLIGLEMSKLMKLKEEKGLVMAGNNIIMDPSKLYPPPTLVGHVSRVSIANNLLNIEMNDGKAKPWPTDLPVQNPKACVAMWGGDVLINTNLVLNAKILELDGQPDTPMVFALDFYREQLEAGYVVSTKSGAMITYLPDVNTYSPNMGRFTPPAFPIPGMTQQPSDLWKEGDDERNANTSSKRK
jgi:hypothetical protein